MEKNLSLKRFDVNKGAWTAEEDRKLAEVIAVHGAKRWKTIPTIAARQGCKFAQQRLVENAKEQVRQENTSTGFEESNISFDVDDFFDFSKVDTRNFEWVNRFLEVDDGFKF
ncbi:hypothetical protein GOBAR_DD20055 [Gossypium barbadense]|nr:hypothetical protein GOBAR_DD20055 [Gossypium barbadense]